MTNNWFESKLNSSQKDLFVIFTKNCLIGFSLTQKSWLIQSRFFEISTWLWVTHYLIWIPSDTDGQLEPTPWCQRPAGELPVASRGWPGREQQGYAVRSTRAQPSPLPQVQGPHHDDRIHAACVEKRKLAALSERYSAAQLLRSTSQAGRGWDPLQFDAQYEQRPLARMASRVHGHSAAYQKNSSWCQVHARNHFDDGPK